VSIAPTEPVIVNAQHEGDHARVEMLVPRDLFYFRGHFPNYPVLPGIVQTHWAITQARHYFDLDAVEIVGLQVKFKRPIGPEQRIQLDLTFVRERARLSFEYRDGPTVCSSGVISLSDP
jgi:3-hydroxymyristoyl/3-hydroxydecanoyl-(acyl carrier protein) dehydratase